ncbi:hypothetical protein D0469_06990 [Peribacillus saganii]|uniref:Uncharacterized protein n=1 Tax=Peribacillus saganii TaxID=2303992 RepID=A0A372LQ44_9BACI|nr:hypothetical protein [Peribacillus saganii]RFU70339.1 hypothetical protein D0469_06990 [Peribacillus saganii]
MEEESEIMNPNIYLDSLQFKLKSAAFHHMQTLKSIKDFNEEEQLIAVSSEFTAMMLTFQSSLDIIAQWVNAKLLNSTIKKRVYFDEIFKYHIPDEELNVLLLEMKQNELTKYLRAFCNVTKHRNIIGVLEQNELFASSFLYPSGNLYPGKQFVINKFRSFTERNLISQLDATFMFFNDILMKIISYIKDKYLQKTQ